MKFRTVALVVGIGAVAGAGYGYRTYRHNADPVVRAARFSDEGRLRDALNELRTASRTDSKDPDIHVRIGQLQSRLADPVAAEKEFRLAISLGADRSTLSPDLGEAILVQGRYRDVLRDVPPRGPTPSIVAKNLLLRAVAQLSTDDLPGAQATLADARSRAPDQAETFLIAARFAAARNDLPAMRQEVAEVLRRDPNQVEALLMQEKIVALDGNRTEALSLADRAVNAAPWSAMARIERASQLIYAGNDKKAQDDVNAVLQAQPRFMDAVYLNGILMARRGQLVEAAIQLEKLDSVSARIPQGLYYQSIIAQQQGNLQTAAEFARRYNQLVPQDPDGLRALGRTELALGHPAAALPPLQRLVTELPKDADAQDLLGRAYAAVGQVRDAAKALEAAIALAPDDVAIRFHYGVQQLQAGRRQEAAANLQKAFTANPAIPGLGASLAEANIAAGDPARAEAVIEAVRGTSGDTAQLALLAAQARLAQGDAPGARTQLGEAVRKYPNATDLRVQYAQLLIQGGQVSDAVPLLNAVLAKEPARFNALVSYIRLKAGENDLPAANKTLEAAHRAAPRNVAITAMLADGLIAGKDPQRAIDVLRETAADSTMPPLLAGALARAQLALGRIGEAKTTYRALLAEHPEDLQARGAYAGLLTGEKDYAAVDATLRDALRAYPGNYSLLSGLVANAARWNGVEAGLKMAEELQAQPGAMPAAAGLKGDLLLAVNQVAQGARAYLADYTAAPSLPMMVKATTALSLSRDDAAATRLATSWLKDHPDDPEGAQRLAQLDIQAGRYAEAQTHLGIVLAARPNDPGALNNLAWSYFMVGDDRALPTAQRAYLQEPSPSAGDTLGWILVKNGSAKAAVPLLQRAVAQRPDQTTQYHLAAALAADGRVGEALLALKPLADGPAFPDQDAARKLATELTPK